jgi:amino acid transporter
VASWVGNLITLGSTVSAFGCCLACSVGGARLLYALTRDGFGERGPGRTSRLNTPAVAGTFVIGTMAVIVAVCVAAFGAKAENTFVWGGAIGTLILLVAYMLTTLGAISLVFIRRKMPVPMWQVVIPVAALVVLGYTLYRNVIPYPTSGAARWFPVVSGGWLLVAVIVISAAPGFAHRLGERLAESEGITPEPPTSPATPLVETG